MLVLKIYDIILPDHNYTHYIYGDNIFINDELIHYIWNLMRRTEIYSMENPPKVVIELVEIDKRFENIELEDDQLKYLNLDSLCAFEFHPLFIDRIAEEYAYNDEYIGIINAFVLDVLSSDKPKDMKTTLYTNYMNIINSAVNILHSRLEFVETAYATYYGNSEEEEN